MVDRLAVKEYNVLDLFSGAGGLTEGFCQTNHFNMISHVEMNNNASKTLETRMLYYKLKENGLDEIYKEYMSNFDQKDARSVFLNRCSENNIKSTGVINEALSENTIGDITRTIRDNLGKKKIDVIIGGPPCQAYSSLSRWYQNSKKSDTRLDLYKYYIQCLSKFKPRMFVFENVPGLQTISNGDYFNSIQKCMTKEGYEICMNILDAADFGVIQHRKRIIFIGWRKKEKPDIPVFEKKEPAGTIHDLIMEDLPILNAGEGSAIQEYRAGPNKYLRESGIRDNKQNILLQHVVRPTCDRDIEIYRLAIMAMNEGRRIRYPELPEELKTHRNQTSFIDRFKVVNEHGLSHSMLAHISRDGHYYIHPDINHPRSLSVREAARIQSFPDNYIFEGPRGPQLVQIGNAVPPLMAKGIAEKIIKCLSQ